MVLFQKQTTQVKDKYLKKQVNFKFLVLLFLIILFSKNLIGEELDLKIITYLQGLKSFSSKFIQSNEKYLEEGNFYKCKKTFSRKYLLNFDFLDKDK